MTDTKTVADRPQTHEQHRPDNGGKPLSDKPSDKKVSVGEHDEKHQLNQFKSDATSRINAAASQLKEIHQKVLDLSAVAVGDQQKAQFNEVTSQLQEVRSNLEQPQHTNK